MTTAQTDHTEKQVRCPNASCNALLYCAVCRSNLEPLADVLASLKRVNALLFLRTTEKDTEALDAIREARAAIAKATGSNHGA